MKVGDKVKTPVYPGKLFIVTELHKFVEENDTLEILEVYPEKGANAIDTMLPKGACFIVEL